MDMDEEGESASAQIKRNSHQFSQPQLKNQRYLTYRASLANSVRGSLMECSVPEERGQRRRGGGTKRQADESEDNACDDEHNNDEEDEDDELNNCSVSSVNEENGEATNKHNSGEAPSALEQRRRPRNMRSSRQRILTTTPLNSTAYATHHNASGAKPPQTTVTVDLEFF